MKRSTTSTNALLQKVSSQLKGDIIRKPTEEDDLEAYIKGLTQKTAQHKKSVNFEDVGDISISSELDTNSSTHRQKAGSSVGSKFLKKNTGQKSVPAPQSKFLKKPQTSAASPVPTVSSQSRPGTSKGPLQQQAKGPAYGQPRVGTQKSSSLDKAAALTQKIAGRQTFANTKNVFTLETDSEDTFSTPRASNPTPGKNKSNRVLSPSPRSVSSDSVKIGRDGGKFMKKKQPAADEKSVPQRAETSGRKSPVPKAKQIGNSQKQSVSPFLKSSQRYSTDVVLSSEEESLAEFITGLDADSSEDGRIKEYMKRIKPNEKLKTRVPSPPPRRTPSPDAKPPTAIRRTPSPQNQRRSPSPKFHRRSPSPVFRRSRSSDDSVLSDSLQSEVIEERDESDGQSISSEDGFKFNLMDANSFEPVVFETKSRKTSKSPVRRKMTKSPVERKSRETTKTAGKKQKHPTKKPLKEKKSDVFSSFGLHTVEELLGVGDVSEGRDISEASEIRTESSQSEIRTEKDEPFKSVTEIVSEIHTREYSTQRKDSYSEDFEPSISERIGMSSKSYRIKSASEIRTRHSSEGTADDYTEEFGSDTESIATISRTSAGPPSEMTISDSYTDQSGSYSYAPEVRKSRTGHVKMKNVEVQTAEPGLKFSWDSRYSGMAVPGPELGMGFVDPTPIATHVVSPETLETMTAYSPSMIALHDMLRQQLELTRDFLKSQRYMYQCMMSSVDQRHNYTTLEDTRQYIRKHRKKRLSFKEALRMVDAEMER
ncbi:uncharacterized protein C19orf44 homolog [Pecten maximus]|uniref:uncharacterized protein C19orf44 homolog n=1 Tax=Pecten maximus TaxID=6579 RepID=UPI0014584D6D|nr:uncharacterized protein C19orf44 homolog [Pecten maximus]